MTQSNQPTICRTCLAENITFKSLFTQETVFEEPRFLSEMLMACSSLLVTKGDGLPENVCLSCVQEIHRSFMFAKLCEKSDKALRWKEKQIYKLDNYTGTIIGRVGAAGNEDHLEGESDAQCDVEEKIEFGEYSTLALEDASFSVSDNEEPVRKKVRMKSSSSNFSESDLSEDTTARLKILPCNKTGIIKPRNLPRTCEVCNKTFRFNSNLVRHQLTHTGEKPFLCNVCGKSFGQMSYLKLHSFIHTGEKPYKCKRCDKSFAAPGTLMTHMRIHTGERPHRCKICGKDFSQSGYLRAHTRTHTGEKPVECKLCHRRFNQSGRLIVHMRMHSGEKPYSCMVCGRGFAIRGTLNKHFRTHTGEKPYICDICGQSFTQRGTLTTHMRVHRPKAKAVTNTDPILGL